MSASSIAASASGARFVPRLEGRQSRTSAALGTPARPSAAALKLETGTAMSPFHRKHRGPRCGPDEGSCAPGWFASAFGTSTGLTVSRDTSGQFGSGHHLGVIFSSLQSSTSLNDQMCGTWRTPVAALVTSPPPVCLRIELPGMAWQLDSFGTLESVSLTSALRWGGT